MESLLVNFQCSALLFLYEFFPSEIGLITKNTSPPKIPPHRDQIRTNKWREKKVWWTLSHWRVAKSGVRPAKATPPARVLFYFLTFFSNPQAKTSKCKKLTKANVQTEWPVWKAVLQRLVHGSELIASNQLTHKCFCSLPHEKFLHSPKTNHCMKVKNQAVLL